MIMNISEHRVREDDPLTKNVFLEEARLKKGKACGPDGIPGEVFKNCDAASTALYTLVYRM